MTKNSLKSQYIFKKLEKSSKFFAKNSSMFSPKICIDFSMKNFKILIHFFRKQVENFFDEIFFDKKILILLMKIVLSSKS